MVSEKICLDIIKILYGKTITSTEKYMPGTEKESVRKNEEANASDEDGLYQTLLVRYDLHDIDSSIRWLELSGYLGRVWPFGRFSFHLYKLTDKACAVAQRDGFDDEERELFYSVDPYAVFIAHQFTDNDREIIRYITKDLLQCRGFKVKTGTAEGLEEFRRAIIDKIRDSRFFLCLLTKRDRLESGLYASSVWLYQEIGAAVALGKNPLVLIEEGIDSHFAGELQKTYEYIEFSRNNYSEIFQNIPTRLRSDLENNLIPLPSMVPAEEKN